MVLISRPLGLFRGLRPILTPVASLAQSILSRWSARDMGRAAWQGQLRLERQVAAHLHAARRTFRRLSERWDERGRPRRAFQPLGLPAEVTASGEAWEDLAAGEWEAGFEQATPGPSGRSVFAPAEPSVQKDLLPAAARRVEAGEVLRSGLAPRAGTAVAARQIGRASAPGWPFLLVVSRREQDRRETMSAVKGSPAHPAAPAQRSASVSETRARVLARAGLPPAEGARAQPPDWPFRLVVERPVEAGPLPDREEAESVLGEAGYPPLMAARAISSAVHAPAGAGGIAGRALPTRTGSMALASVRLPAALQPSLEAPPARLAQRKEPGARPASELLPAGGALPRAGRTASPDAGPREVSPPLAPEEPAGQQEWPLFGVLRRLETRPPEPGEPTALQILRRMWPQAGSAEGDLLEARAERIRRAAAELGPGEALAPEVRRRMEALTGRDLGEVRLHSSPLAQALRAEAFTSGRHIVFAPGRFEPSTPQGLALLGHELTHLGQPLAFKPESGAPPAEEDLAEQAARRQEEQIQHVIENGWPEQRPAVYRRPPASTGGEAARVQRAGVLAAPRLGSGGPLLQRAVEISEVEVSSPTEQPEGGQAPAGQPGGAAPAPGGAPEGAGNVEALARQVYDLLKERLRSERDRHQLYRS